MLTCLSKDVSQDMFKGNTLIIPAISVGNVGQLACDLLISTLDFKKVGYFCPKYFLPIVGNNPFATSNKNETELTLNCEVFNCADQSVTVMQIRSPLVKGKQQNFCHDLVKWMQQCQFDELIVLSSCHAYERSDEQLIGKPFRYLITSSMENIKDRFDRFQWKKLEERNVGFGDRSVFLPGGGFSKKLFEECCNNNIRTALLIIFCSEGDNIPEAMSMAGYLNTWKEYVDEKYHKWKPPSSWVHLFGNAPPSEIF